MYGELPSIETAAGGTIEGFPVMVPNPEKTCVLRLPTNDELRLYLNAQKSRYVNMGRRTGKGEEIPNPKADRRLFTSIRLDKGEDFSDAEVLFAISQLTRTKTRAYVRDGQHYIIKIGTVFGEVTHVMGIPMQDAIMEYERNVMSVMNLAHGVEERRFPPEVPEKLYDSCAHHVEGYLGAEEDLATRAFLKLVPPHHKSSVIAELMFGMGELDPSLDPNF